MEIAERNQIKERSNISIDIFGDRFQKGFIQLSQPMMCIRNIYYSLEVSRKIIGGEEIIPIFENRERMETNLLGCPSLSGFWKTVIILKFPANPFG